MSSSREAVSHRGNRSRAELRAALPGGAVQVTDTNTRCDFPEQSRSAVRSAAEGHPFDPAARYRNSRALVERLDAVFAQRTLAEWENDLRRHPLIWSPVRRMHEVIDDPHVRAMGYFSTVTHPVLGTF